MAFKRRLDASWMLTDGILPPFPVGGVQDVLSAVTAAGYAPDPFKGLNLAACEWVYSRRWTYSSAFETPQEGEERVYLLFERLCGRGEVLVNGCLAGRFKGGETLLDITGQLAEEGENRLEVRFEPLYRAVPGDCPMPQLGLGGGVWMKAVSALTLERSQSSVEGHTARFEHAVNVHVPGVYTFVYTLSLDGELIKRQEFSERLAAAPCTRVHEIMLDNPLSFDPARYDETAYDVLLSVERAGLGCERAQFELLFGVHGARKRGVLVHGALTAEAARDIRLLGGRSVCVDWPENTSGDARFGLFRLEDNAPHRVMVPISDERWLVECAERDCFDETLLRLRGGDIPFKEAAARYGESVLLQPSRLIRLLRAHQACAVMRYALKRRREDRDALFEWNLPWEALCGGALTERGGRRPAWHALREAWRETVACAELPEGGAAECGMQIKLPIWLMSDAQESGLVSVLSSVISEKGEVIAAQEYTAAAGRVRRAGTLTADLPPRAGVYVVRCEVSGADRRIISRCDEILCAYDEAEEMAALAALPQTVLTAVGREGVRNVGEVVAFAAGRCLMPGETDDMGEWINARLEG